MRLPVILFIILTTTLSAQTKKEQIISLQSKYDSLLFVLNHERYISNDTINKLKSTVTNLDNKNKIQENKINRLLDDSEFLKKNKADLNSQIKLKNDSIALLLKEFLKTDTAIIDDYIPQYRVNNVDQISHDNFKYYREYLGYGDSVYVNTYIKAYSNLILISVAEPDYKGRASWSRQIFQLDSDNKFKEINLKSIFKNELLVLINKKIKAAYNVDYKEDKDCHQFSDIKDYTFENLQLDINAENKEFEFHYHIDGACFPFSIGIVSFKFDEIKKFIRF